MAPSPFSLVLRHLSRAPSLRHRHLLSPFAKHFSFSSHNPSEPPKPSSLSARLSIVFDQIDQIEKERAEKDDALQRIRTWRESRKSKQSAADVSAEGSSVETQELGLVSILPASVDSSVDLDKEGGRELKEEEFELVHPWPEWIEFMERLVQHNYFDHRRKDEDKMIEGLGLDASDVVEEGFDFLKDWKSVQTAGLNFGRDRFDIFRSLTRQDIQMLVGYGCPSSDRKAVFSSKLLRKYVHLDEGDVCSSCSLRSTCDKAYLVTNKEDEARTMDVVRVLLTYGFEPINGSVVNKDLLKKKSTKMAIRKLLHEVVKLSSVPIDPNLPPPIIKKRPPKVKQPPPPPRRRIGRDDIEMKKGDWLCAKCDFMNFAKNAICLQCDARRPKRQLLPGEWECPQCNFLNYRRNMACFHCEHKRPPDEYTESEVQDRRRGPTTRPERVVHRQEVSNAWNFDFDDDESDGADVAAFENADAPGTHENSRSDMKAETTQRRRPGDDAYPMDRNPRIQSHGQRTHGTGFDDFEDEEDDDIDNYELEDASRSQGEETSSVNFSDIEDSMSEDDDVDLSNNHKTNSRSRNKSPTHRRGTLTGSDDDALDFGSEDDLPIHPKWKSSHVADSRQSVRAPQGRSRGGFDSEEDGDLPSGSDNDDSMDRGFRSRAGSRGSRGVGLQSRTDDRGFGRENFRDQRQAGRLDRQPRHCPDEYDNRSDNGNHFRNNGRGGRGSRGGYGRENSRDQRQAGPLDRQPRRHLNEHDDRSDNGNHFRNNGRGGRGSRGGYGRENSRDQRQAGPLDRQPRRHLNEHDDRSDSGTRFGNNGRGGRGGFGRQRGQFRESNNWSDKERHFEEEGPRRPRVNVR